jgi:hypothetical protein
VAPVPGQDEPSMTELLTVASSARVSGTGKAV